jgi:hypothetical protein
VAEGLVEVKNKIISLWLHFWLKRIAKRYPDFFSMMLEDLDLSEKEKQIMHWRYVKRKKFKELPQIVFVEERQVYRLHNKVIKTIINL